MGFEEFRPIGDPMDGPVIVVGVFGAVGICITIVAVLWWFWRA